MSDTPQYDFKPLHDLEVQAMLFDMDIDYEAWTLLPKNTFKHPVWLQVWRSKQEDADFDVNFDIDRE